VELGPATGSSSSSSSSKADVATAGIGDSLEDLIGYIGSRRPGAGRQRPNPPKPPQRAPRDPNPRCIPVLAKKPPPGWSYYYDSLMRRGGRPQAVHSSSAGEGMAAAAFGLAGEESVLGTCTGDEF
jgi:hypothetical protein